MKISIIMAAYNSQATIGRSIESFLQQDYFSKELIVVDGASQDQTCAIVREFESPLIRLHSERDMGIYDAMNKGLVRVSGQGFGCLNSDDCYARPDALSLIAAGLQRADIVSGGLNFVREHDGSAPVRVWHPVEHRPGAYVRGFSLPHPTTYARRAVLDRVGSFSTDYRSASDYDWLLRALDLEGFSHAVINEVLVNMRIGGESTSGVRAIWRNSREMLEVRRKRLGSGAVDAATFMNLYKKCKQRVAK